jgi:hypothetical protein
MSNAFQTLVNIPPPFNMIVVIVLIVFTTWLFGAIAGEIRKYACHRKDVELKQELVARGLSAEEIERIVAAKPRSTKSGRPEHERVC